MPTLDGVDGTFYEVRQNPQSFSIGINITANTTILTNGQSIGLTAFFHIPSKRTKPVLSHVQLIVEASFLSLGAIIAIFISIAVCSMPFGCAVQYLNLEKFFAEKCATL